MTPRRRCGPRPPARLAGVLALGLSLAVLSACGGTSGPSAASPATTATAAASATYAGGTPVPVTAAVAATAQAVDAACASPATFAATDDPGLATQPIGLVNSAHRPYCLGPALAHDQRVEATVIAGDGGGQAVTLAVPNDSTELWNQALRYCFAHDPAICPQGQLAVLLAGELLSVPNVTTDHLQNNQLIVGGRFADGKPADVAARFRSGSITLRPVLR